MQSTSSFSILKRKHLSLTEKLRRANWLLVALLCILGLVGIATLISAADGALEPWAGRQAIRFLISLGIMLLAAITNIRFWMRYAYLIYITSLALLATVEIYGTVGMGAQRWINLGPIQIQPSETMKVALTLTLARYFYDGTVEDIAHSTYFLLPLGIVLFPVALVLKQPDLGTATMMLMSSSTLFFLAGVRLWIIAATCVTVMITVPVAWQLLHDYQRKRILAFLKPESDPLGAGYHILQSKIALGSGGLFGKGFGKGTQSHLNFLPEKQTDFIFTMWAEENGLVGSIILLLLYAAIVVFGYIIILRCRNQFSRLLGLGIVTTFFLYTFINTAMVMGLVPVVGVPLPLVSYGGTAMMTIMFSFGLLLSVDIHRNVQINCDRRYS